MMERVLNNKIHAGMLGNHTIFPPNIADTGSSKGVQLPRRGAGGGESVGSEAGGDGGMDDHSSARDSDQNAGSGAQGGKRKNARHQTFEAITNVMDRHGQLMASTIDSSSKRQCSILTRQCDILEQEVAAVSPSAGGGSRAHDKKRDAPHNDAGGADRGGRQVKEAKKDRRDGAPFSGDQTDGDGWGRTSGTDDNDVFSTGAPGVQLPPLPSNVRAIAGGSSAQATTHDERIIHVEVNEDARVDEGQGAAVPERSAMQPVTLPQTPRQQRTVVATGGATPREVVPLPATPRVDVGAVAGAPQGATAEGRREEDVASATEVARTEKKRAGKDDEPLVNRVHKDKLVKDLAERARLWVDDKSLWTSGEGHKLYNIINETREHLVAVASGLPLANVPRSVAMPRSNIV
ncbi:hypothetical protein CBR_g25790 [Chara braunii]|uniref:Uncharacterized protein n=1 Tax=Chara braunii TaxID=69332 RepID=A0A388L6D1_CHABU|nr:hypothetical protein CBR_g25790 [Chara braunii]|eukprot:GBG77859.1 hypothetical protein CBR_g25790 [Chara braunii]